MHSTPKKVPVWLSIIRWTARVSALLLFSMYLIMYISTCLKPGAMLYFQHLPYSVIIDLCIWFSGLIAMLFAFKWEGIAGGISVLLIFIHFNIVTLTSKPIFDVFYYAIPGILFLISWQLHKKYEQQ